MIAGSNLMEIATRNQLRPNWRGVLLMVTQKFENSALNQIKLLTVQEVAD
jgi:hypothetical protein